MKNNKKEEAHVFLKTFIFFILVISVKNILTAKYVDVINLDYVIYEWIFPILVSLLFSKLIALKAEGKLLWRKKS